jgi:hypothetical protein
VERTTIECEKVSARERREYNAKYIMNLSFMNFFNSTIKRQIIQFRKWAKNVNTFFQKRYTNGQ